MLSFLRRVPNDFLLLVFRSSRRLCGLLRFDDREADDERDEEEEEEEDDDQEAADAAAVFYAKQAMRATHCIAQPTTDPTARIRSSSPSSPSGPSARATSADHPMLDPYFDYC
mmetsp:Transcript_13338/g.40275  ORF Transcript_13338/g.40275 Transcript_13338/m.40275 type:complete len:113 (-) Transcript_13338:826-1164(-)